MKLRFPLFIFASLAITLILLFLIHGGHPLAVLIPKGWVGLEQRKLMFIAIGLMLLIVIPVLIIAFVFAWKYRDGNDKAPYSPEWDHNRKVEAIWWLFPCAIVVFLGVVTWHWTYKLDPYKPIVNEKEPLEIQVVALDWKWLFLYPKYNVACVNFCQFPIQTPLAFEITADAPMNSFWIPQLGGQIYAMAAMTTKLHLIADEAGDYRGLSANLSGDGFAGMVFTAKASSEEEFEEWLKSGEEAEKLDWDTYQKLSQPSSYVPATLYSLEDADLFKKILGKYEPE